MNLIKGLSSKRNDINLNCVNCKDVHERLKSLSEAKFTLILQDSKTNSWSISNMCRLIEALKCSTIPVLIGNSDYMTQK